MELNLSKNIFLHCKSLQFFKNMYIKKTFPVKRICMYSTINKLYNKIPKKKKILETLIESFSSIMYRVVLD